VDLRRRHCPDPRRATATLRAAGPDGQRARYSDTGFQLLIATIEAVTGQTFGTPSNSACCDRSVSDRPTCRAARPPWTRRRCRPPSTTAHVCSTCELSIPGGSLEQNRGRDEEHPSEGRSFDQAWKLRRFQWSCASLHRGAGLDRRRTRRCDAHRSRSAARGGQRSLTPPERTPPARALHVRRERSNDRR
jgi:hypothetical protein